MVAPALRYIVPYLVQDVYLVLPYMPSDLHKASHLGNSVASKGSGTLSVSSPATALSDVLPSTWLMEWRYVFEIIIDNASCHHGRW